MSNVTNTIHRKTSRDKKGKSLIDFPVSFTVIDLETTGLSPTWDSIIELSAIKIQDSKVVDSFSSLVNSESGLYLDDYIIELTGITQKMIDTAPKIVDILPKYIDFIGSDIIIGHNVNFDINFLYDNCVSLLNQPFTNDFIDTMRISRKLHPEFSHHRLEDLSDRYEISVPCTHRALADCYTTFDCFLHLKSEFENSNFSISDFYPTRKSRTYLHASDIKSEQKEFDCSHPLYNKVCVFTGTLEKLKRRDAMQIVADFGGINHDRITTKTNFLVLGNNDYCVHIKDGKSNKLKKAEQYKLQGHDIEIISENVFYDMIFEE